jgi:hypothetical protein
MVLSWWKLISCDLGYISTITPNFQRLPVGNAHPRKISTIIPINLNGKRTDYISLAPKNPPEIEKAAPLKRRNGSITGFLGKIKPPADKILFINRW